MKAHHRFDLRIEVPLGETGFTFARERGEAIRWEEPDNRFITNIHAATLTFHLPVRRNPDSPFFLICPGGGYGGVSLDKEGHYVSSWLAMHGMASAVLKYRLAMPSSTMKFRVHGRMGFKRWR